ncbi:PREDICTED: LON peptidase N-terminal domain and RING finger protein 1-like, partial [Mesitornis unicolor]|uniref:LON peptidase N-terminal domain and RING finger protein 1-like n=1 Tax=Mesitornis unicolor TaxID=54374 RepID=UPI0005293281
PDASSLRLCRAEVFVALGQHPQALEDLDAACRAEPGDHEAFFRKGKVLLEMGQRAEALLAWEHCLTLSPHFHPARREMDKILMRENTRLHTAAARLGDAHRASTGSQIDGGSSARSSSPQAQDQEAELTEGGGDAGSEHGQGTATLPQPGPRQEAGTSSERQDQQLLVSSQVASLYVGLDKAVVMPWGRPPEKLLHLGASEITASPSASVSLPAKGDNEEETAAARYPQPCLEELLSLSDLECSLCIRLFFEPVTTPCGHTFCKECLERCLDHRPNCPLCKQSLREYLKAGNYNPTVVLQDIMLATFPTQLSERRDLHRAEMAELSNLTKNIPIFVCTMSFPGVSCPLHVFEPRYRLMIRRCQETGTRRFGMCIYEKGKSFADYGCMLEIRHIELLADGRSLVDTIGRRRFRVLSRGHRDGYNTADIEYLEDKKVAGEELQELQCLHESTYRLAQRFCEHGDLASRHILMQHGPLPEKEEDIQASADGPTWCWWLISMLPLDPSYQLNLFSSTSLRVRLTQLQRILAALLQQPPAAHPLPERSPQGCV